MKLKGIEKMLRVWKPKRTKEKPDSKALIREKSEVLNVIGDNERALQVIERGLSIAREIGFIL